MKLPRLIAGLLVVATLAGCRAGQETLPASPPATAYSGVSVIGDVEFGAVGNIRTDVCLPSAPSTLARPAIISVHGGGWRQGDKAERPWRDVCAWLASEGFVVFQPNYRLAPADPFPAAIDDVTTAVEWIRDDEQVARFGHDPARLGAFGDSAGGNLVALLGTRGEGDTTTGSRVSAVAELSAPLDLTREGIALGDLSTDFQRVQLDYLGCASYDGCPGAATASPLYQVDSTDPPFFIAHAVDDPLIPIEQAEAFAARLEGAQVEVTYLPVASSDHALSLLTEDLRTSISAWLHTHLAP
jgi:acetyl esterase